MVYVFVAEHCPISSRKVFLSLLSQAHIMVYHLALHKSNERFVFAPEAIVETVIVVVVVHVSVKGDAHVKAHPSNNAHRAICIDQQIIIFRQHSQKSRHPLNDW
jgi:hypothetical protein